MSFSSDFFYWKVWDFCLFAGDIISVVDLGVFGRGHQALGPNH